MATKRVYYALQNVQVDAGNGYQSILGVQSVGVSSTVNTQDFSAFGSLFTAQVIDDADFEITVERIMTGGSTLFGYVAKNGSLPQLDTVLGFGGMDPDVTVNVQLTYSDGTTGTTITMPANISSISANMSTDGALTESITFVNAGNAIASASTGPVTGASAAENYLSNVITKRDFRNAYLNRNTNNTNSAEPVYPVLSFNVAMNVSQEKLQIMGQSLPAAKFATYPIECTMEIEGHEDPTGTQRWYSPVHVVQNGNNVESIREDSYAPIVNVHTGGSNGATGVGYSLTNALLTSLNRQGGDVGGGNASITWGFTGYNCMAIVNASTQNFTNLTTPASANNYFDDGYTPPSTIPPSDPPLGSDIYDSEGSRTGTSYP